MGAEDNALALFDFYWFRSLILHRNPPPPPSPPVDESPTIAVGSDCTEILASDPPPFSAPTLLLRRHRRSRSDELAPSPELRIQTIKLQTILSGKVAAEQDDPIPSPAVSGEDNIREQRCQKENRDLRDWMKKKKEGSKSLSDLEFQELKGFMDLGFTFSDEDQADPRLISIVPGLQRLRAAKSSPEGGDTPAAESFSDSDANEESAVQRPYLSEAWGRAGTAAEKENLLKNWRIPAAGEGVDLKNHLRLWAHSVASAVR